MNGIVAVAAQKKDENAEISMQAGRAPFYLIFDINGMLIETLKNPFSRGGGGAGFGVAKMLSDKGVQIVVAGKIGSNMTEALKKRSISFFEIKGRAKDALTEIKEA